MYTRNLFRYWLSRQLTWPRLRATDAYLWARLYEQEAIGRMTNHSQEQKQEMEMEMGMEMELAMEATSHQPLQAM